MIKVILLERIERLGKMGQTVSVRPGFARNYLLPHKKALRATKENLEIFEKQRAELEAKNEALRLKAEENAKALEGFSVVIIRQASEMGMLFGSVTTRDIAEVAQEAKKPIERQMIQIATPIKTLGLFPVKIKLHPEVALNIIVNVARSEEEAKAQVEKEAQAAKAEAKAAKAEAELAALESIGTEAPAAETSSEEEKAAE
jgi:large subunit ribosomal protein L9